MANSPMHVSGSTSAVPLALFAKGFRPFFLVASAFAVLALPIWLALFATGADAVPYFGPQYWHAHEMVFGFAAAVIAGFLLTAVSNWTSRETAAGPALALLVMLWLVGRAAVLLAHRLAPGIGAALDLAFLPAVAIACGRPIVATKNFRNLVFVVLLTGVWLANLGTHLGALGIRPEWLRLGNLVGVDLVVLAMVIVGGRVIPMFTRSATRRGEIRNLPALDRIAVVCVAALVLADAAALDVRLSGTIALVAGLACALRARTWGMRASFDQPLLWVLHGGHAFITLGLLLRVASAWFLVVPSNAALHALTAGAIGMLTLGMMTRVGLGHTGRILTVPRRMGIAFAVVALAALLRVAAPFGPPTAYVPLVVVAGVLWSAGFAVYLFEYAQSLWTPRVDGRAG